MPLAEQGLSKDRYKLIPRTLIFIQRGESFLLLRGAANKQLWANKFNGVGGHVERGEDILSSARRELLEETGLSVDISLKGVVTVDVEERTGIGIYIFTGSSDQEEVRASDEGVLEWVKRDALESLPLVEDVRIFLDRIIKMKAGDPPFFARSYYGDENKLTVEFSDVEMN
jgi:8-oxo-dGTP diphosphatase